MKKRFKSISITKEYSVGQKILIANNSILDNSKKMIITKNTLRKKKGTPK